MSCWGKNSENKQAWLKKASLGNFPGSTVVKTSPFNAGPASLIPGGRN